MIAGLLAGIFSIQVNAAEVTQCGDNVCFTYDDSTLFGSANVVGNNIFFLPTEFVASSVDDEGATSTFATINVVVESITEGFDMTQFMLLEQGDYRLDGRSASVTAAGMLAVTSLTQTCGGLFPCRESDIFNVEGLDTYGAMTDWEGSAMVDLTSNQNWGSDTKVTMTIENRLSATTLQLGDQAFIEKKFAGVGITVVPVPAAVWLLGSALGGLGLMRRRKTVTA